MKTGTRTPRILSELLSRRLNAYMLAAGAAGAAVLAAPLPAGAEPVCAHTHAHLWGGGTFQILFPGQKIAAFNVAQTHTNASSISYYFFNRAFLNANTAGASAVIAGNGYPADLSSAAIIGSADKFGKGNSYGLLFTYATAGRFGGQGNLKRGINYVGLKFSLSGQPHYGWARMRVTTVGVQDHQYVTVIDLQAAGYETVPSKAIQIGANCSNTTQANSTNGREDHAGDVRPVGGLGALALGAEGIPIWRKR